MQAKWHHYKVARGTCGTDLSAIFLKWFHIAQFWKLDRQHQRSVKTFKREQLNQMIDEAQRAFHLHDPYKLFRVINKRCPKIKHRRIHLKGPDGDFYSPAQETAAYCSYVTEQWTGPELVFDAIEAPGVPFTYEQLLHALECIPTTKSVASPFAPGAVWKAQAHFLTEWLFPQLQDWWSCNPPFIPQEWKDGWLCMLPKPGKSTTCVENLRPLALQEPVGKAIIKLLTRLAVNQSIDDLSYLPQFAYLGGAPEMQFFDWQDTALRLEQ